MYLKTEKVRKNYFLKSTRVFFIEVIKTDISKNLFFNG